MGKRYSKLRAEELEELKQTTHFTPKELNIWYRGFLRECPSGTINKEEFCQLYRRFFPFGDPTKFACYIFNAFDVNRDGRVEFREFVTALSVTSRGTTEEKLHCERAVMARDGSFRLYDHNHDGFITRQEMMDIVDAIYKMVGEMVIFSDEKDTPQHRVNQIFSTMDTDGDGQLSWDEFLQGAKNDPAILQGLSLFEGLIS